MYLHDVRLYLVTTLLLQLFQGLLPLCWIANIVAIVHALLPTHLQQVKSLQSSSLATRRRYQCCCCC